MLGLAWGLGCGDPKLLPCEERDDEAVELPRVPLVVAGEEISAEVADTESERATAWAGRTCELGGLVWVPEAVGPAAVTLCEVEIAVDLAFVRDGEVVALELDQAPCSSECEQCPRHGVGGPAVDAVVWLPAGEVEVAVGDAIEGLDAVALPSM